MKHTIIFTLFVSIASIGAAPAVSRCQAVPLSDDERSRCVDALVHALDDGPRLVRVHAAEALVSLGRPGPALAAFRPDRDTSEPVYRVLVWRVLAAAEPGATERRAFVERIRTALLAPNGPDQTHALESLAKLNAPATTAEERRLIKAIAEGGGPATPFALWRLEQTGEAGAVDRLARALRSQDGVTRIRAAYVLGRLRATRPAAGAALLTAWKTGPPHAPARGMLRAAASDDTARELIDDAKAPPGDRYFAAMFLAETGGPSDGPRLAALLRTSRGDPRIGAAYALLKIDERSLARSTSAKPRP